MGREIKFRAWDGETLGDIKYMKFPLLQDEIGITVMQYTGLKDKNGREIYEGDILAVVENMANVTYSESQSIYNSWTNSYKHIVKYTPSDLQLVSYYSRLTKCEVIGNIYENLELLEGATH